MVKRLFVIANEGLHPVAPKIERKYKINNGEKMKIISATKGNTPLSLSYASVIAKHVHKICIEHDDYVPYLIWSGMPVYNLAIYNIIFGALNKRPIVLVYNRDINDYEEYNLDPRYLMFDHK